MKDFSELKQSYLEILSDTNLSLFDKNLPDTKFNFKHGQHGLSGLFLASEPDNYWTAKYKVMIIGAETRGWNVLKESEFTSLHDYIELATNKQKEFFYPYLDRKPSKIKFYNFARQVANKTGKDGLVYANLFCFSWKRKSPIALKKSNPKLFDEILNLSIELVSAQIDYFDPDIIIWANGITTYKYRRKVFPLSKCKTIDFDNGNIKNRHLWKFIYDDKYLCYRIHHPASWRKEAHQARKHLISLLPEA